MKTPPDRRIIFWIALTLTMLVFIFLIRGILLPFVLGILTAYFLDPATDRLERLGLTRGMATSVITAGFFIGLGLVLTIIIPVIAGQLSGLVAALPEYIADFEKEYEPQFSRWLGGLQATQMESIKDAVSSFSGSMAKLLTDFMASVLQSGIAFLNLISLILITPIVTFYLLRDWDHVVEKMDRLLPREHIDIIHEQLQIIDNTLAGFIRGQLNVCAVLAVYYALALSAIGLKFGLVIGIGAGLLVILPYVGFMFSMLVALTMAFFQFDDQTYVMMVLAVFLFAQVVESYFLTPKLVGEKVGLHPVWVIFGMLAGAALFGFVGVLLAIPATAVIGVLLRFAIGEYMHSEYYTGGKAAAKKPKK